ncbi:MULTISPECIES: hypothetical protein [unclassified Arcicella]|uniref:hypothetical protein n=1 Tax=unclassified Arcicella TaxID=2644986 RepID=UPI002854B4B1|nr:MULTISPECIES: hypothetical protein [unclassified Arcicella]MDR6560339.1 hypothetical protein [Arcicella sp. BE51]MDR6810055.1 hypothetical protein [Arcicella sp. BE140]MDR6821404.1 hypothetical protein [Arcicella sp. BE139]
MKVKIFNVKDDSHVDAEICEAIKKNILLPSLTDGWRFNFKKHSKVKGTKTYILVCEETSNVIEGCLIFKMKDSVEPYMAYIEIAPHNHGDNRKYDKVAGCLIAFACRLSFIHGERDFKGWLAFDILEEDKVNEIRLMNLYSKRYNALRFGETTMVIPPEGGEKLINEFLQ